MKELYFKSLQAMHVSLDFYANMTFWEVNFKFSINRAADINWKIPSIMQGFEKQRQELTKHLVIQLA